MQGLSWWFRWLRICLRCRRPRFDSCVGKTPQASEQLSPCAVTTEACVLQSPCTITREAITPQLEKSLCSNEDPQGHK